MRGLAASPTSTATLRSVDATLEQRQRMVERIGDRLCGPMGFAYDQPGPEEYVVSHSAGTARGRSQIAVPRKPSVTRAATSSSPRHTPRKEAALTPALMRAWRARRTHRATHPAK
jgi:hypothetical protein